MFCMKRRFHVLLSKSTFEIKSKDGMVKKKSVKAEKTFDSQATVNI